jgi:beta-1,4-mannosyltransferase
MSLQSESAIRVAIFGYSKLNPYLLLYKEALECQGLTVGLEGRFDLKWLITRGRFCDVIHLHWIGTTYTPAAWKIRPGLANKLVNNRLVMPLRGALRLANVTTALLLAKLRGKAIVYTVHNLRPHREETWPFVILNRIAHRVVLFLANRVHAHNHYTRKILETDYNRRDGVSVVPLGNHVGYYPNRLSRFEARQQLGVPDDAFVYLFLGLIRPYKGVEDLIDAFEELELPASQLLVVGRVFGASYREKLLNRVQNNPAIKLVPEFIPDEAIQLYMNGCDICVLPYRNITTSSAAVLALSFGRPVIAPAIASFPELVTPETGILYDPSSPDGLVSALRQARQQSWSESRIVDYARQFDWDRLGPQLADLYQVGPCRQRHLEAILESEIS